MRTSRRQLLALAAATGASTAGCLGTPSGEGVVSSPTRSSTATPTPVPEPSGHVRPSTDPQVVPSALHCETSPFARPSVGAVVWGTSEEGLALRVHAMQYERGDRLRVTLTNVAGERVSTTVRGHYFLQVYTEAGWQTVFGLPDSETPMPYVSSAVSHAPGEGFEWRLPLTPSGVVSAHAHGDDVTTCPGLPAGRYRFAFGLPYSDPVAVAFDLRP